MTWPVSKNLPAAQSCRSCAAAPNPSRPASAPDAKVTRVRLGGSLCPGFGRGGQPARHKRAGRLQHLAAVAPSGRASAPHEMKDAAELAVGVSPAGFQFDRGRRRYLL